MVQTALCTPGWWTDPSVIFTDSWLAVWKRRSTGRPPCFSERANALMRTFLSILIFSIGFSLYNHDLSTTVTYSLLLGLLITLPDIVDMLKAPYLHEEEGFRPQPTCQTLAQIPCKPPVTGADISPQPLNDTTLPTPRNPFMNVLVDEIKYKPNRLVAESIEEPTVKASLDDFFRVNWFSDPTDVFGKSQSQRQFITAPSTTIPNDQESYQNWLYRIPGKTCKEGGRESCVGGTNGAVIPWLNDLNLDNMYSKVSLPKVPAPPSPLQ
jgi:hypothetical protein